MSFYTHSFEAQLAELVYPGKFRYFIIRLPREIAEALPFETQVRVRAKGEMNDRQFAGAWMPDGERLPYLHVSREAVEAMGLRVGDDVEVRFNVAPADEVDVPDELQAALDADPAAQAIWDGLTPGRRRGLAHMIRTAKQVTTREKRARQLITDLRAGPL